MMTGLAYMPHLPRYVPYAWVFVVVVVFLILLIFVRMYVLGDWFRRRAAHRAAHRSGQPTVHRANRVPQQGGSHGHRAGSRRRPNRH
jgi:uncharacterized membrane protein YqiK